MLDGRRFMLRALLGGVSALAMRAPAWARSETYTYDALGRLTSVTYDNGDVLYYVYDSAGNRTTVQRNGTPPPPPPPLPPPPPSTLVVGVSATTWDSSALNGDDPPVAALASGGVPPYSWTWQRVTGVPAIVADSPTASWTTWTYTGSSIFPPLKIATWRCRVIDAASTTVYSPNVTVTIDVS